MFSRENVKKMILLVAALLLVLFMFAYRRVVFFNNGGNVDVAKEAGKVYKEQLTDASVYEQTFVCDVDMMRALLVEFSYGDSLSSGQIKAQLFDADNQALLGESTVDYSIVVDGDHTMFDLRQTIGELKGKKLKVVLTFSGLAEGELCINKVGEAADSPFVLSYIYAGKDSFYMAMHVVYVILIIVILGVFALSLFAKNFKLEMAYLISALGIGIIMSLLIPYLVAPDETTHTYVAYDLSNKLMGVESGADGYLVMRYDDAYTYYEKFGVNNRTYMNYYFDNFFNELVNGDLVQTNNKVVESPWYLYIFSALGITVGRLLGLGSTMTFMLGRWFNMLFFIGITFLAIKKIPFGKAVVYVWALLPIMLQQTISYSYDCVINSLCVLVIALTLRLLYRDFNKVDMALLVVAALLLIPCKGHALVPMSLLPLMLLVKLKDFFKDRPMRKKTLIIVGALVAVMVLVVGGYVLSRILANANGQGDYIEWAEEYAHPLGYYILHIKEFLIIYMNTFWKNGDGYLIQALGGQLGWLNIEIPVMIVLPFLFLLVYGGMRREDEEDFISIGYKTWMWIIFVGVFFLASLGMLLCWTPASSTIINGVQGRYALPGMVLPFLTLRTKSSYVSKNGDKVVACAVALVYVFVATNLMMRPV